MLRDAAMAAFNRTLREYAVVRCHWWFAKERGEAWSEPLYPPLPSELQDISEKAIPEESSPALPNCGTSPASFPDTCRHWRTSQKAPCRWRLTSPKVALSRTKPQCGLAAVNIHTSNAVPAHLPAHCARNACAHWKGMAALSVA